MSYSAEVTYPGVAEVLFGPVVVPGPAGKATLITASNLAALAEASALSPGTLYSVVDAGTFALATSVSTCRSFFAAYVGPTAPADTSVIWFDTSNA